MYPHRDRCYESGLGNVISAIWMIGSDVRLLKRSATSTQRKDIIANNFCENCQTVRPERSTNEDGTDTTKEGWVESCIRPSIHQGERLGAASIPHENRLGAVTPRPTIETDGGILVSANTLRG